MNTQIISQFKEKPKITSTWWAMVSGLFALVLGPIFSLSFNPLILPWIEKSNTGNNEASAAMNFGPIAFIICLLALFLCIRAFRKGERSWVSWVGLIAAILSGAFWIFMIVA